MINFSKIATGIDVSKIANALRAQPDLFDEITERQSYEGSAHKDTKAIFLRWCKGLSVYAAFTEIPAFNFPAMGKLPEAHELINLVTTAVGAKELGRLLIVSLRPGGVIAPHADEGVYADHYERFHLVLDSDEGNYFHVGDETAEMRTGELWWFNHKECHTVANNSSRERIHMIIDCVAPAYRRERQLPAGQHAV